MSKRATDRLRAADALPSSGRIQGSHFVNREPHRDDLHGLGATTRTTSSTAFEFLDVIPRLGLVGPLLDLLLCEIVLPHGNIVNEKGRLGKTPNPGSRMGMGERAGQGLTFRFRAH